MGRGDGIGGYRAGTSAEAVNPRRLVVKVGTSTLTNSEGRIDRGYIADLTAQLAIQRAQGRDVLLVTSGAIRAGRETLNAHSSSPAASLNPSGPPAAEKPRLVPAPDSLPYRQAAAAIGQGRLMHIYTEAFAWRGITCAQVLLTRDDLSDGQRMGNARNTLLALLALGAIPVINENDTVAVDEIKFGDNDTLAARVACLVEADLLLLLSDVEGLYNGLPSDPAASVISSVACIDAAILSLAGDSTSGVGTGGMKTKIEAARIATQSGIRAVIARGRRERVITDVLAGQAVGTTFLPT